MISLKSFSSYENFARADIKPMQVSDESHFELFKKDLTVIQDFTTQIIPKILAEIFYLFDSGVQLPISADRKQFGRKFELIDDNYPDGKKLTYEDCSIILESQIPFPESKNKFALNDFKYYTIRLDTDTSHLGQPRTIFIRGALTPEGKYVKDAIEQFSYTSFTDDGFEDGIVFYTNSTDYLNKLYGSTIPNNQKFDGGAIILDIDRPFAPSLEDVHAKQMLLLKSGFALRTV